MKVTLRLLIAAVCAIAFVVAARIHYAMDAGPMLSMALGFVEMAALVAAVTLLSL